MNRLRIRLEGSRGGHTTDQPFSQTKITIHRARLVSTTVILHTLVLNSIVEF